MSIKKWILPKLDKEKAASIADAYGYPPFLSLLLVTRGFDTPEKIEAFLQDNEPADPFSLPDMEQAVERVSRAVDSFEKIAIYGDYDADGVTATAMLYSYLEARGADVTYYIPLRESEGYGLQKSAIDAIAGQGVTLLITVDNGISSWEEVEYAKSQGIDTVVTDHHEPPERLPDAVAVVDPHRKDSTGNGRELCGAGVAFMLILALEGPDADQGDGFRGLWRFGRNWHDCGYCAFDRKKSQAGAKGIKVVVTAQSDGPSRPGTKRRVGGQNIFCNRCCV